MRTVTDQIRIGVMWFSILLVVLAFALTAVVAGGRIDSPEEFVMALRQDKASAVPLAVAVFLLVLTLPRPAMSKRAVLAVFAGLVFWLSVWQWLVHCDYTQIRVRGGNPEQMLQAAKP